MGTGVPPLRYGALRSGFEENLVLPRERVSDLAPPDFASHVRAWRSTSRHLSCGSVIPSYLETKLEFSDSPISRAENNEQFRSRTFPNCCDKIRVIIRASLIASSQALAKQWAKERALIGSPIRAMSDEQSLARPRPAAGIEGWGHVLWLFTPHLCPALRCRIPKSSTGGWFGGPRLGLARGMTIIDLARLVAESAELIRVSNLLTFPRSRYL
jgi:hypothetical protein